MIKVRTPLGLSAALFLLAGCETPNSKFTTIENYLGEPSSVKLSSRVYFVVQDQRPQIERQPMPKSAWTYTVDGKNPNQASLSLGSDLCRVTQNKGITDQALHGLPGDSIPAAAIVFHIDLISWYGRLEKPLPITGTIMGVLNPSLATITAEGHCKYNSTLEYNGRTIDLGVSEGSVSFQTSQNANIAKEGNQLSGAASDEAMAQFFKAFENQFNK